MRERTDRFASTSISTSPRTAGRISSLDSELKGLTLIRPGPGGVSAQGQSGSRSPAFRATAGDPAVRSYGGGDSFNDRFLRKKEVVEMTGLSRSTIDRYVEKDMFPKPRRIGPNSVRWLLSEILVWMASRPPNGVDPDSD